MLSSMICRQSTRAFRSVVSSSKFSSFVVNESAKPLVSVVQHSHPINGVPISTNKEEIKKELFAVVGLSGTQYKVTVDDVIVADKMTDIDIGDTIDLDKVLLVGNRSSTVVGRPLVPGAKVLATVEEITRDKKVITLKVRRRKNSQRIRGFRRQVTILRIQDIVLNPETAADVGL